MRIQFVGSLCVLLAVIALCLAQLVFKSRLSVYGEIPLNVPAITGYGLQLLVDWYFVGGLTFLAASSALWYMGLSRLPLSVATPLASTSYPLILLSSYFVLDEALTVEKVIGNGLVIAGILLILPERRIPQD